MRQSLFASLLIAVAVGPAWAEDKPAISPAEVEAAVAEMFKPAPEAWKARLIQDETQRTCSLSRNAPPADEREKILAREKATIVYPPDGNVLGDWTKGESIAQVGAGGQFTDDPAKPNGGNCYACHEMARSEVSFGTLGPSLAAYGKQRRFEPAEAKATYAKIFNAQSVQACSNMPRFGYHKFLTIEQIKDVTAYLMSPESPVNK